jgi:hypothetical protein
MSKKIKKVNPILDYLISFVVLCVIGLFVYGFYSLLNYEKRADDIEAILRNVPLEEVQRKNSN